MSTNRTEYNLTKLGTSRASGGGYIREHDLISNIRRLCIVFSYSILFCFSNTQYVASLNPVVLVQSVVKCLNCWHSKFDNKTGKGSTGLENAMPSKQSRGYVPAHHCKLVDIM